MEEFFKSVGTEVKRWPKSSSTGPGALELLAAISGKDPKTLAPGFKAMAARFQRMFCGPYPAVTAVRVQGHAPMTVQGAIEADDIESLSQGFVDLGCHDIAAELLLVGVMNPQIPTDRQAGFVTLFLGIERNALGQLVEGKGKLRLAGHAAFLSKFENIELGPGHPWKLFFDSIDPVELEAAHRDGHHRAFGELLSSIVEAYEAENPALSPGELIALLSRFKDEATKSRIEQLRVDVLVAVKRILVIDRKYRHGADGAAIKAAFAGFESAVKKMKGYQLLDAVKQDIGAVKTVLARPALPYDFEFDVNLKGISGHTALQEAIRLDDLAIVQLLLDQPGIDPNVADWLGYPPLQTCVYKRHYALVRMLLKHPRTDVNACTPRGAGAALHAAIRCQDVEMVKLLLAHPLVDVNLCALMTPLECALTQGHKGIIKMLKDRNATSDSEGVLAEVL